MFSSCSQFPLLPTKLVAIAQDTYLKPTTLLSDNINLPGIVGPKYGQDITYGYGRIAPENKDVGATQAELKLKMRKLLKIFASGDTSRMAENLFNSFLTDTCRPVGYFDSIALNAAAESHPNINHFCDAALSAPNLHQRSIGKHRIHQALKDVNWDIRKMRMPAGLGVPAFNLGSKAFSTQDFQNGLGVMINGVQYVYV